MMRVRLHPRQPRMLALFNRYLDLVLMRLAPQAFPASRFLLALVTIAFFFIATLASFVVSDSVPYAVLRAALSVLTLAGFAAIVLAIANRRLRINQTVAALLGGETVIGLVQLPVLLAWSSGLDNVFIAMSLLAFLAWELVFFAHVYRNALDRGMGIGLAIAVIYILLAMLVEQAVLPFPETAASQQANR